MLHIDVNKSFPGFFRFISQSEAMSTATLSGETQMREKKVILITISGLVYGAVISNMFLFDIF